MKLFLALCLLLCAAPAVALDCSGTWQTTYGELVLRQHGDRVTGTYYNGGATIAGTLDGSCLSFTYDETTARGEGKFTFADDGQSFTGTWRAAGTADWSRWDGTRGTATIAAPAATGFAGVFSTSYGMMRLQRDGNRVSGLYAYSDSSSLSGTVSGSKLTFRYTEPDVCGEGWFELSADGNSFAGKWKADNSSEWASWSGERVVPAAGEKWLVVLETPWETSLREQPYAFGEMLEVFFKREPSVRVRRRSIGSAGDFRREARGLAFLTGPVVVLLSGHGDRDGFIAGRDRLAARDIADALARNPEIILLNFSCCSAMAGDSPRQVRALLPRTHPCAVSGYTEAVDWAASAGFEFLYLDSILSRDMTPAAAAALLRRELNFTGSAATGDSPFGALGFTFIPPPR